VTFSPRHAARNHSSMLQGIDGKNTKSRADCCDQLTSIIQELGVDVVRKTARVSSKSGSIFKQLAICAAERDAQLRKSALAALMAVYEQRGVRLWALLGDQLTSTQKDLITERAKYVERELAAKGLAPGDVVRCCHSRCHPLGHALDVLQRASLWGVG
jgi:hypothetical protein